MFITNLQHLLNHQGDIPEEMPEEAREMAGFLAMVVDYATQPGSRSSAATIQLGCLDMVCSGFIQVEIDQPGEEIHWKCNLCDLEGVLSNWRGTKWDNFQV